MSDQNQHNEDSTRSPQRVDLRRRASDGSPYPRQPIKAVVEFFEGGTRKDGVTAVTGNLSGSGLFAQMDTPLAPGKIVSFRISLRRSEVEGLAEVVWAREKEEEHLPPGAGLQFLAVKNRDHLLKTLLAFDRRLSI